MTAPRAARLGWIFSCALTWALTSGCATGELLTRRDDGLGEYDPQDCVENALRGHPDGAVLGDAIVDFTAACREGETASCSVLGVMYELGRGVAVNAPRALQLYDRACEAHNMRACANLGDLLLSTAAGAGSPRALAALGTACAGGQGRACQRLSRAYREGERAHEVASEEKAAHLGAQ